MKFIVLALMAICFISAAFAEQEISEFTVKNLNDEDIKFSKYKGKCLLIINTASGCGFTNLNMGFLNRIYNATGYEGLQIIAFPSNQFGQEKKSNKELDDWFKDTWKAKYDYYGKIDVKESPVYKFLIQIAGGESVYWNYGKYLVQKNGKQAILYGPQRTDNPLFDFGFTDQIKNCVKS